MLVEGFVVNNSGRFKHIFKRNVSPGMKIAISELWDLYKDKYGGKLDTKFLDWLQENKIPKGSGFDIVVETISEDNVVVETVLDAVNAPVLVEEDDEDAFESGKTSISKITARQIAGLKTKDNPKSIIGQVSSIHKLRRALTMSKDKAGKETLTRYIRERIIDLQSAGIRD